MKQQKDRHGRHKRLLVVWVTLVVVMATAITVTGVSILSSQIRKEREETVTGAAKLASKSIPGGLVNE